jgi:hypothetical protein
MGATKLDLIPEYFKGMHLKAEDFNALVQMARAYQFHGRGYVDAGLYGTSYKEKSPPVLHGINKTGADLPAYSLFSVANSSDDTKQIEPPMGLLKYIDTTQWGSHMVMLTNGQHVIPKDAKCEPTVIGFDKPVFLRSIPTHPAIGEQCGPAFGASAISSFRHGLVCLSSVINYDSTEGVWVTRTREPIKVVGCVTTKIKPFTPTNKRVGTGQMRVLFRNPNTGEQLTPAFRPSNTDDPWIVNVYNYTTNEYDINALVSATETMGIGLTVNNETVNTLCSIFSSSSKSSSSKSSSSKSSSSSDGSSHSSVSASSPSPTYDTDCCGDVYATMADWPPLLNVEFSGAPCGLFNQTRQFEIFGPGQYQRGAVPTAQALQSCTPGVKFGTAILSCAGDHWTIGVNGWTLSLARIYADAPFSCRPFFLSGDFYSPFNASGNGFVGWCHITVTEP